MLALVLFTLAKSLVWAFVNPPLNVGDESAHLMYIMQVRNNAAIPVFKFAPDCSAGEDSTPPEPTTLAYLEASGYTRLAPFTARPYESYQPPLYYLTVALAAAPLATDDVEGTLYAGRSISAVLVAITVLFFALAVRELTARPLLSLAVALLVSSVPTFGFFGGVLNNDGMLNLFAAATLLVCLRTIRTPITMLVPGGLLLGALAGGALLTKASGAVLVPVGLFAQLLAALRLPDEDGDEGQSLTLISRLRAGSIWRRLVLPGVLYGAAALGIAGWMMVSNLGEYGDLFGTANTVRYGAQCWGPTIIANGWGEVPRYLMSLALLTPFSFLATFGWGDESIGVSLYYVTLLPLLLVCAYVSARWLRRHFAGLSVGQKMGLAVLASCVAANLVLWISFNFTIQYQPTGRYLYMALLPIGGFLSIAIVAAPPNLRLRLWLFVAVLVLLHGLTLLGWLFAGTGWMAWHAAQLRG